MTYSDNEIERLFREAVREHLYCKYLSDNKLEKTIGEIEKEAAEIKQKLTTKQKRRILASKIVFQETNLLELIEREENKEV
ncbi:MAG: hypothetical protein ACTSXD_13535 [Candidatus Heimdallarchaeaceae archaeon]